MYFPIWLSFSTGINKQYSSIIRINLFNIFILFIMPAINGGEIINNLNLIIISKLIIFIIYKKLIVLIWDLISVN